MIKDLGFYSENFLKIMTKDSKLNGLEFNQFQKQTWTTIEKMRKAGKPVRLIILKARQIGMSTFCSAYTYHSCATNFYTNGVVIADKVDNTNNLFNMAKRYYQFSPAPIRPMLSKSNEKALVFENPDQATRDERPGLMSSIKLESANNLTAGRSGTTHVLHCSEVAFWNNPGPIVTGLLQSVPRDKNTAVMLESTANGITGKGEEFYNRWQNALDGSSDYYPLFYPWYDHDEYKITPDPDYKPTDRVKNLMEVFPQISIEQAAWYDWKMKNDMGSALIDPEDQMRQEYPSSPEEAFITSGRPVFKMNLIMDKIEKAKSHEYKLYEI